MENTELQVNNEELDKNNDTEKASEEIFNHGLEILNSYGLVWNYESIDYILNIANISFGQLRSCLYIVNGQGVFNVIKSTLTLIQAGLLGSGQYQLKDYNVIKESAYKILDDWRVKFGSVTTLHLLIIYVMEQKHFFTGRDDLEVMNHLKSANSLVDLVNQVMASDLEEKIKQLQAMSEKL